MKIDLVNIAKEVFKDKKLIIKDIGKDKFKVFYKNRVGNDPKPFVLPEFVNLDQDVAEAIGIYCGDGKFASKDLNHIDICTIDPDIAKFMFTFFTRKLNVKIDDISFIIYYRNGSVNRIKFKWSRVLGIPTENFLIQKTDRNRSDALRIQINGKIFCMIFKPMIKEALPIIRKDPNLRKAFLRGEFAADGGIGIEKDVSRHYIVEINFAYNAKKETWLRNYILGLLTHEGFSKIKWHEEKNEGIVKIHNWKNYLLCWKIRLFDKCSRKKQKFLQVVREMAVYIIMKNKFRDKFFSSISLTQREIAKIIGSWQGNVCKTMKGIHNLRVEQVNKILKLTRFTWNEIIQNTMKVRIGQLTTLEVDPQFMFFLLKEKNLS